MQQRWKQQQDITHCELAARPLHCTVPSKVRGTSRRASASISRFDQGSCSRSCSFTTFD